MDALRSATDRLIDRLIDLAANKAITSLFNSASGGLGGLLPVPSAMGNVFDHGRLMPFASGGIITHPIVFPMARGLGLAGEAGPEAIMPLRRTSDGNLGVYAQGAGDVDRRTFHITITNNITSQSPGDPREQKELSKQVAHYVQVAVRKALIDERKTGNLAGGMV